MVNFAEIAARKRLGAPAAWKMFAWELIGQAGDCLIEGGVPVGEYKSGPRKGRPKWNRPGDKVVIRSADEEKEKCIWETETGKCADCDGTTESWAGWSAAAGDKYKPCRRCNATGLPRAINVRPNAGIKPTRCHDNDELVQQQPQHRSTK